MHRSRSGHQRNLRGSGLTTLPVPAASVVLLREAPGGFEVFMARRHIKSDFAPDVYVFPGGKADASDGIGHDDFALPPPPILTSRAEPDIGWAAIYMAAIRELFEETGLLLAKVASGEWLNISGRSDTQARFDSLREKIRSGSLSMAQLAKAEGLRYAADELRLLSNWITPEILTRRFDTFFFVTRSPRGQDPRHADLHELTHSVWITPTEALNRFRAGHLPLVFASEKHLELLATLHTVDAVHQSTERPIDTISPRWVMRADERVFLIPGDPDYETARIR